MDVQIQGDIDMVVFDSAKDNVPDPGLNTPCTLVSISIAIMYINRVLERIN